MRRADIRSPTVFRTRPRRARCSRGPARWRSRRPACRRRRGRGRCRCGRRRTRRTRCRRTAGRGCAYDDRRCPPLTSAHCGPSACRARAASRCDGVVDDVDVDEQPHLVEVRRHQRGQRKQLALKGIQRARVQQRVAVHRRAHRVDDERHGAGETLPAPGVGDGVDDRRRGQHAGLGGLHADVGGHRLDLAGDDVERDLVKTLDARPSSAPSPR